MVIAGGEEARREKGDAAPASTEPAMVIAGGPTLTADDDPIELSLQRSRRW